MVRLFGFAVLALAGCDADANSDVVSNASDPCDDAPVTTWNNFGDGFMRTYCQGCHATDAPDRFGAPASVTFDDLAAVVRLGPAIADAATGETPRMPPAGGVSEGDRARLALWLRCDPAFER